jgi:uncharacterized protein (TIGR03085 family)
MSLATLERAGLADALAAAGPERSTLCEGWTTRDLLAHLLVREGQPLAAVGILVPALASVTDRAMRGLGGAPYPELVGRFRAGPPAWSPYRIGRLDAVANDVEFFVHHEDVRRGEPGWEPRPPDAERDDALWELLLRGGRMFFRRSPVGVAVRRPSGEQAVLKAGRGLATVVGEPGELLLFAFGRDAVRVEIEGTADDVAALKGAPLGV